MTQPPHENHDRRQPYLWLALATVLLVFANGRWIIPIAAWLAPVFMLRFLRTRRTGGALLLGYLGAFGAALIGWTGMVPVPAPLYVLIALSVAAITFLPFLIDRWLAHPARAGQNGPVTADREDRSHGVDHGQPRRIEPQLLRDDDRREQ